MVCDISFHWFSGCLVLVAHLGFKLFNVLFELSYIKKRSAVFMVIFYVKIFYIQFTSCSRDTKVLMLHAMSCS